ncbi:MAG: efflux RND transporter periplasmic adaptor subunit [Gemmatimonadaceae bacterium]|nr:efflux RND transporter periplasmic adaptor subunit [Gemmatimonadaceae bacterium]
MSHRTQRRLASSSHVVSFAPFVALVLAVGATACAPGDPPPPPPPQVTVARVIQREVADWDEFTGRLQAVDAVEVRPRVSGYIQRVTFKEGKEVKRGDVLFVIDPRPYQAELDRATAQLEEARTRAQLAEREVQRAQTLIARQAISREELDARTSAQAEAEAAVRAAAAAVESAKLNLDWTRVRAPIDGRVGRAEVTEGNLVQSSPPAATLLTTIVSVDPVYVYFDSDEQTYLKYTDPARHGNAQRWRDIRHPVYLGLANEDGFPHKGYVDFVDNRIDPTTGTIRARAVFSNAERIFTPGLFARVKLIGSQRTNVALVRDAAVGTNQDRKFVLVLKPDSTVDYRPVRLGRVVDGLRIVREGLAPGELIVVNGLQRVRPGMKVTATVTAMAPDTAGTTTVAVDR